MGLGVGNDRLGGVMGVGDMGVGGLWGNGIIFGGDGKRGWAADMGDFAGFAMGAGLLGGFTPTLTIPLRGRE